MSDYYFERECRTPYSEAYNIMEDEAPVGRLDLHFTSSIVHATLSVVESLTREAIEELVHTIDEEILDVVGLSREEFICHVHQGRDMGVYSNHGFGENGEGM
jgi:hypothetical protein